MSGFFAIYNRQGQGVPVETVDLLHGAMSYWNPDDSGRFIDGSVALGHEMLWNTPESHLEHLPFEQRQAVLTMDARIDNRGELAGQLALPDRQITDSEYILAAYRKWGEACPGYLVGDFAFVIWDKDKKQLFCARDHLGVKPFYYHLTDSVFVCSNDIKALVAHPDISKTLCDEAVANYLVHHLLINSTRTFFEDIKKLPAAHSLTITATSSLVHQYWHPEEAPCVKLANAEAYALKLRDLVEQAIHDRMRSAYPITSHLSGGLDSSAIAVIAARKLRKSGERLLAFNWVYEPDDDADPNHFEWAYSRKVAEAEGIEHSYVSLSSADIVGYMQSHTIAYGDSAGFWYEYPVREAVQNQGSRTILSGWGGDELSTYHGEACLADMVRTGNLLAVAKEVWGKVKRKRKKVKQGLSFLYHTILSSFIPRRFYKWMPKSRSYTAMPFPFALKEFAPVLAQEQAKAATLSPQPYPTVKAHMLASLGHGHLPARMESWAAEAFACRLEYAYPLLDKRIVEFVLGVPAKLFVHAGVGRHLFRVAMLDVLSDSILWDQKGLEMNRVRRLCDLSLKAHRKFIDGWGAVCSSYVDAKRVEAQVLSAGLSDDERVFFSQSINNALMLINVEKKNA